MTQPHNNAIGDIASLSVRRPVLAAVLSLLIVVAGLAALFGVQVRELPEIDRPVISVRTSYDGASPETVDAQITGVIEGAVSRVTGVVSISSRSESGSSRVTIEFSDSVDLNVAAGDVREAVSSVRRRLPDEVEEPAVLKADADARPIIQLFVSSDSLRIEELTTIVEDTIADRLAAVDGVADVQTFGTREEIFAVTIDTAALAARDLSVRDLEAALSDVSMDAPAGNLDTGAQTLVVRANAGIETAEELAGTYIDAANRVGDVASVTLGPSDRITGLRSNGAPGIGIGIVRQAQSNTLTISEGVREAVAGLNRSIPQDVHIEVSSDDGIFIEGAVREVVSSLALATAIVIGIIFVFLRSARATLIPAVTVAVSLIGTLAGIWLAGFSVNILTLLALVLATGMVVDDAIVVIENIERRRAQGLGPRAAAVLGTRQVFFAVIATTATLAAVFIPISFFPGTAGRLFSEFGFVLAIAVALSSVVALTLCPMMASRMLPAPPDSDAPACNDLLGRFGTMSARIYARTLDWALKAPLVVLAAALAFALAGFDAWRTLPEQLTPQEDRGIIMMMLRTPQGASLDYTESKVREVETVAQRLVEGGEATSVFSVVGRGDENSAYISVPLVPWEERERSQQEIAAEMNAAVSRIIGARVMAYSPNSLGIRGGGEGLRFAVTGTNYDALAEAADDMVRAMEDRLPGLTDPMLSYDLTQPQLSVDIDRERAADLGISVEGVATTLQTVLDGREVGEIFIGDEAVPVRMEVPEDSILSPADLENLYVEGGDGALVPLSSVVSIREVAIAPSLSREGQMRAVSIRAGMAEGYDLRSAVEDVRTLAAETLPAGMGVTFLSEAATLEETSRGVALTFGFALLIILLVLAAQFESFTSAIIIMSTVPFGLAAAALAMVLTGGSLNIFSQIGLVMLIGLMAKNGILIVEFANQLRDQGRSVGEAIREASDVRFRPVMMTMISTVLGGVPLVIGTGAGAEAREVLGWIVVGGLGLSTLFTLYLTPVAFLALARLSKPRASEAGRLVRELAHAAALPSERPR